MATKVKELIEMLKQYNQEGYITNEQNQDFIHIRSTESGDTILSVVAPIGECNRTRVKVYPSVVEGYSAFSPELDEDLYKFEFTKFRKNKNNNIMKLKSVYSSQKDFYGKANVITEGGQTKLKSYSTIVAVKEENKIKVKGWYSKTTAIHINEFLLQNGAKSLTKKEMELEPTINL